MNGAGRTLFGDSYERRLLPAERAPAFGPSLLQDSELLWAIVPLLAALMIWQLSLGPIDPDSMSDLGLPSVLPRAVWICLPLLSAGFFISLSRPATSRLLPYFYLISLAVVLHATPIIDYGTLRYPWAWKHLGIVDYIQRHGAVDRHAPFLSVYHNWPGLFAAAAMTADLIGVRDISNAARWAPLVLNLLYLSALLVVYRQFTRDDQLVFCSLWIFLEGNWVGQDYFSPQGVAFFFYLTLLAVCLRFFSRSAAPISERRRVRRFVALATRWAGQGVPEPISLPSGPARIVLTSVVVLLTLAIAATHPLTPMMTIFAFMALTVLRRLSPVLLLLAVTTALAWDLVVAYPFILDHTDLRDVGTLISNFQHNIADTGKMSPQQVVVAWMARLLTLAIIGMAMAGGGLRLSRGYHDGPAAALALAPIPLIAVTSYGGEVIFRAYFFALPFLSFFAAALFFPKPKTASSPLRYASAALLCTALSVAFVFANNGKDRSYVPSREEMAAMRWLHATAPANTFVVEGDAIYPTKFANYENFTYLTLSDEPEESRAAIMADPESTLGAWMRDSKYAAAFVVITRSQQHAYLEGLRASNSGLDLDRIEKSLRESPHFQVVFDNRDAHIFTISPAGGPE